MADLIRCSKEVQEKLKTRGKGSYEDTIKDLLKNEEVVDMVEKVVKKVVDERMERRKYWEAEAKLIKWGRRAFLEGKIKSPPCRSCFCYDYKYGKTKAKEEYCNMTQKRVTEDIEKNSKALLYGQVLGVTYDFVCPQKHRLGFSANKHELKRFGLDAEEIVHGKAKS